MTAVPASASDASPHAQPAVHTATPLRPALKDGSAFAGVLERLCAIAGRGPHGRADQPAIANSRREPTPGAVGPELRTCGSPDPDEPALPLHRSHRRSARTAGKCGRARAGCAECASHGNGRRLREPSRAAVRWGRAGSPRRCAKFRPALKARPRKPGLGKGCADGRWRDRRRRPGRAAGRAGHWRAGPGDRASRVRIRSLRRTPGDLLVATRRRRHPDGGSERGCRLGKKGIVRRSGGGAADDSGSEDAADAAAKRSPLPVAVRRRPRPFLPLRRRAVRTGQPGRAGGRPQRIDVRRSRRKPVAERATVRPVRLSGALAERRGCADGFRRRSPAASGGGARRCGAGETARPGDRPRPFAERDSRT